MLMIIKVLVNLTVSELQFAIFNILVFNRGAIKRPTKPDTDEDEVFNSIKEVC